MRTVDTTCPYCGTGCTLTVHVKGSDNRIARVSSNAWTGNEGWLCVKGRFGYQFREQPGPADQAAHPAGEPASSRKRPGPPRSSIPRPGSGRSGKARRRRHCRPFSARCTNEENYLFQKFMRAAVGTNNVDHCARL